MGFPYNSYITNHSFIFGVNVTCASENVRFFAFDVRSEILPWLMPLTDKLKCYFTTYFNSNCFLSFLSFFPSSVFIWAPLNNRNKFFFRYLLPADFFKENYRKKIYDFFSFHKQLYFGDQDGYDWVWMDKLYYANPLKQMNKNFNIFK